jgi:hypothetical protein
VYTGRCDFYFSDGEAHKLSIPCFGKETGDIMTFEYGLLMFWLFLFNYLRCTVIGMQRLCANVLVLTSSKQAKQNLQLSPLWGLFGTFSVYEDRGQRIPLLFLSGHLIYPQCECILRIWHRFYFLGSMVLCNFLYILAILFNPAIHDFSELFWPTLFSQENIYHKTK